MVKTIEVESIGDFVDIAFNAKRVKSNHTICSRCIFRGQNSEKYRLTMEPHVCDSIWNDMVIAQHHGIPTRFLDFSFSPLLQ